MSGIIARWEMDQFVDLLLARVPGHSLKGHRVRKKERECMDVYVCCLVYEAQRRNDYRDGQAQPVLQVCPSCHSINATSGAE